MQQPLRLARYTGNSAASPLELMKRNHLAEWVLGLLDELQGGIFCGWRPNPLRCPWGGQQSTPPDSAAILSAAP